MSSESFKKLSTNYYIYIQCIHVCPGFSINLPTRDNMLQNPTNQPTLFIELPLFFSKLLMNMI